MIRYVALLLAIVLIAGCSSPSASRNGHLITSFASARHGFSPGDTLREVILDSLPAALRRTWIRFQNDSTGDRGCVRAFAGDSFAYIYQPGVCGREPSGGEWLLEPSGAVIGMNGVVLDSTYTLWIVGEMCPSGRASDGKPYNGKYWRLDGCYRRPLDTPDSLLPAGTTTPLGVILPNAVRRGLLDQCSREAPRRADFEWDPPLASISQLESLLPSYIAARDTLVASRLPRYYRQYGGFGVGRDSLIYVSLGIMGDSTMTRPELRHPDLVCDGGKGFFGVVYDPHTRSFSQLAFNGRA